MPTTFKGTNKDDTLSGTSGRDVLIGLAGNDTYIVNNTFDKVVERADEGTDTVLVSARLYRLPANVENLTFTTSRKHSGIGNDLANVMTGNSGADHMSGGGGDDKLIGGGGKDYLSGDDGNDVIQGGSGNDVLRGGAGNDVLDGGTGADTMYGGAGNDVFIFDNLRDKAFDADGGIDEVRSTVDVKLTSGIENLTLIGIYSANGTGNALNNVLTGNDLRNVLDGKGGRDTLDGGKGNDVLIGGKGADNFEFSTALNRQTNVDLIKDFSHDEGDKIVLSNAIFPDFDGPGRIDRGAFLAGPGAVRAVDDGQFIIYNTTTGALYYDPDGPGGRGPIQFATLGKGEHPDLVWSDFLII